jgi:hypothetical protein
MFLAPNTVAFPFRLSMSWLIFLVFGFFVWLFPDAAYMVLSESVKITPLIPVVGSFFIAPMMASCSALNINDWSFIPLRVDCRSVTTAYPEPFLSSFTRQCRFLCDN